MVTIADIMLGDDLGPATPAGNSKNVQSMTKVSKINKKGKYPTTLKLIGISTVLMLFVILL